MKWLILAAVLVLAALAPQYLAPGALSHVVAPLVGPLVGGLPRP